jgi:hypothetical protein
MVLLADIGHLLVIGHWEFQLSVAIGLLLAPALIAGAFFGVLLNNLAGGFWSLPVIGVDRLGRH